jgi:hypothetical protein
MPQISESEPISIGIDVGWSVRRRTCALAAQGLPENALAVQRVPNPWKIYPGRNSRPAVCVRLFTHAELLAELDTLIRTLPMDLNNVTLVVDGPLGPHGRPHENRFIDSACGRNGFYGRAQPSHIQSNDGPTYVNATYAIVEKFLQHVTLPEPIPWLGGRVDDCNFIFAETHPTIGLATLVAKPQLNNLPSRSRPRRVQVGNNWRTVRAKSDWYWLEGANQRVEGILGCNNVVSEGNHERVAGLFCLAVAMQFREMSADKSRPIAVGSDDGVYALPGNLDASWEGDIGQLRRGDVPSVTAPAVAAKPIQHEELIVPDEPDDVDRGDNGTQLLNLWDNGGVWEKHHTWLETLRSPGNLVAMDGPGELITLEHAANHGNNRRWTSTPETLKLAHARGFDGQHLSAANGMTIPVRVCGND